MKKRKSHKKEENKIELSYQENAMSAFTKVRELDKIKEFDIVALKKFFLKSEGLDNTTLKDYYNPDPYSKTEDFIDWLSPISLIQRLIAKSIPNAEPSSNADIFYYNKIELKRLLFTEKRQKFNFFAMFFFALRVFIGLGPLQVLANLKFWIINFLLFWVIILIEIFHSNWTFQIWYLLLVYTVFSYYLAHAFHLFYKSQSKIEIKKLLERSKTLEDRLGSLIGNYIRMNILYALLLKWLANTLMIDVLGSNLDSFKAWIWLSFDNMLTVATICDILAHTVALGLSDISANSLTTKSLFILINIINIYIVIKTFKIVLSKMNKNILEEIV